MVADDQPHILEAVELLLAPQGIDVDCVRSPGLLLEALGMRDYDAARVQGYVLLRDEVSAIVKRFGEATLDERKKIPGVLEARADVIFAGSVILERVMKRFDVSHVIVSDQGVRWGLVWRELERTPADPS